MRPLEADSHAGRIALRRSLAVSLTLGFCLGLSGQTVSTEILGLVTDASGAVMPGAIVKVKRLTTGDV